MNQTSYLSLFVITGLLVGGIFPDTLAFADEDKVKLKIEQDGIAKIEIKSADLDVELKLDTTDNEHIVDVILRYVDLPEEVIEKLLHLDDSDYEFEYEYENSFNEEHDGMPCGPGSIFDDGVCIVKEIDEFDHDEESVEHDEFEPDAFEIFGDAIEKIEETTFDLQHAHDAGFDITHAEEIIIKAKMLIHDAEVALDLGNFDEAIELSFHAQDLAHEARIILDVGFDEDYDDESDEHQGNNEGQFIEQRIHELEKENKELKEQIIQLEDRIEDLNAMLMEQLKVIYEWILNR